MAALGINLGFFLFQVFNFTIVLVLLYAWAYKPIINALEDRKKKIAQSMEDARVAAQARANAEAEARQIVAKAQSEANDIVRQATERAESAGSEVKAAIEAEVAKIRENAQADAAMERDRILADLRGQIGALAMAATQRLVGEELDEKRQRALINEFFSGVKGGQVVVLESIDAKGEAVEVTSALPLTDKEKEVVRKDIGGQTVSFRVDPEIMGGLVVKIGDKVLDGSVAGQLETLRQSLV